MNRVVSITLAIFCLCIAACAPQRPPVPPGTVPEEHDVSEEDEQYGHEVLSQLTNQYPLSRNDSQINRVRDIVDKLTIAAGASKNPWHVYVLESTDFKNAAATRGNYIFVWSALLNSISGDGDLTTVLSHEIAHALAGHTDPDPNEEASRILSEVASQATSSVLSYQGLPGIVGDLAGMLVQMGIEAVIVNPDQRGREYEADQIGMFLMAKAGIDPELAVQFWEHARTDPEFKGFPIEFLSTHPDSQGRYEKLLELLPQAEELYHQSLHVAPSKEPISHPKKHKNIKTAQPIDSDPSNGFAVNRNSK